MSDPWSHLGTTDPDTLADARLQIHHGARLVAAIGAGLLPPEQQDRDRLTWQPPRRALATPTIRVEGVENRPFALALRPFDLMLILLDGDGRAAGHLDLDGHTVDEAWRWVGHALTDWTGRDLGDRLAPPTGPLPDHPVADGAPFAARPAAPLQEAERWLDRGHELLSTVVAGTEDDTTPRLRLERLELVRRLPADRGGFVELGLSLGGEPVDEPHFLVRPVPMPPEGATLPELCCGEWLVEEEVMAILAAGEILEAEDGPGRRALAARFLEETFADLSRG